VTYTLVNSGKIATDKQPDVIPERKAVLSMLQGPQKIITAEDALKLLDAIDANEAPAPAMRILEASGKFAGVQTGGSTLNVPVEVTWYSENVNERGETIRTPRSLPFELHAGTPVLIDVKWTVPAEGKSGSWFGR
jgi:hypothetical protein